MKRSRRKNRTPAHTNGSDAHEISLGEFLLTSVQQLTTFALAAFGFLFCLLSMYSLSVDTPRVVWTTAILILYFFAAYTLKKRRIVLLFTFLLAAVLISRNLASLLQGGLLLLEQALDALNLRLPDAWQLLLAPHTETEALALTTLALQTLLFLVMLPAGSVIMRFPGAIRLAFVTLWPLVPAIFFSRAPAVVPMFCLLASHLMLFALRSSQSLPPTLARSGRAADMTCSDADLDAQNASQRLLTLGIVPLVAIALLLASLLLPAQGYTRPQAVQALRQSLLEMDFGSLTFRSNDGLTHGSLEDLSTVRFTGKTALKVRVSQERPLYLRDFAGTVYTENGWEPVSDALYQGYASGFGGIMPQALHAAANHDQAPYTLFVQNVSASPSSIWIPNGLVSATLIHNNAVFVQDTALRLSGASRLAYALEALPCAATLTALPLSGNTVEDAYRAASSRIDAATPDAARVRDAANAYLTYVLETYTVLPDETRLSAERLINAYGLSLQHKDESLDLYATCRDVSLLLDARCDYAYSPPQIPENADFTAYFLEESRSGYCVHFATAATVLLRALGLPARYAEGYIVTRADYDKEPDAEGYIAIEDTHAHAWVEVYDPAQLDWIPVEMTPGSDGSAPSESDDPSDDGAPPPSPTSAPTPTPTPEPTDAPAEETSSSDEEEAALPEASPTPAPQLDAPHDASAEPTDGANEPKRPPLWSLLTLLPVIVIPFALLARRERIREKRQKQLARHETNAAILFACRLAVDMLTLAGCAPLEQLLTPAAYARAASSRIPALDGKRLQAVMELAQRARFSNEVCTERERAEAVRFLQALPDTLKSSLPRMKRLLLWWRFPLLG